MNKVAIVTNSLSGGGAEYAAELLYAELRERHRPIFWIGINSENPRNVALDEGIISLNRDKNGGIFGTILAFVRFVCFMYKNEIRTVIINCELPELFSALVFKKLNLIVVEHANPSWFNRDLLGKAIRRILRYRRSSFVVVGSHLTPRFSNGNTFVYIPNPLPNMENNLRVRVSGEVKRLLYVGRLSTHFKNPQHIIDLGYNTNLPIAFIGTGPLKDELESSALKLNVDSTFYGYQQTPWACYREGDLLIIPSSAEGDGLVLIEAIKCGIPFLATDIPDLNRYGINNIHYCVSLRDFCERIQIYRHKLEELIVPSEIVESIINDRSLVKVADKWESLLKSLDCY